jgi:plasmid replication initiation protein
MAEIIKKHKHRIQYPFRVSNDLILSKHDLSAASQDALILIGLKINQQDFEENLVNDAIIKLSNKETQELLKTDHRNIKTIFKRLREETIEIPTEYKKNIPTKFRTTGLVLRFDYDTTKGEYVIHIDEKIRPHFAHLGKYIEELKYTIGNSNEHFSLTFKHSKRLYLYFRKIQFQDVWRKRVTLQELNTMFKTNYKRYVDFNRRVLELAVDEINEKTNIKVHYQPQKSQGSRAYDQIVFDLEFTDVLK